MLTNNYYTKKIHNEYQMVPLGDFVLESGMVIRDCQLAISTFGELNESKNNAILVTTWFSGTNKAMEDIFIGEGRALDPSKYFIVVVNQICNGLSTSPQNVPIPFNASCFPNVRISDDVRAQHQLLTEYFNITSLELVVGGSMGAQQVYEWAVRYPEMVKRAAPIAGTAQTTPHCKLLSETLVEAITSDPEWKNGFYREASSVHMGLRRHARQWGVIGFSTEAWKQEKWRELGFYSEEDFLVGFLENYFLPMDPNVLIKCAWKWQNGDVSRNAGGDLKAALNRIKAKVFVMPIDEDIFFPPRDCQIEAEMISNAEFRPIKSIWGHLGLFGLEQSYYDQIDSLLNELLAQ